jgi:hypothetical protein
LYYENLVLRNRVFPLNDNQSLNFNSPSTSFTSSNNLNQSQNNLFSTSNLTTTATTNISSSSNNIITISFMTQMQAAQINELNSIMACVAMFASSMVVSSQPIIIIPNSLKNMNTTLTPDSSVSSSPTGEGESSSIVHLIIDKFIITLDMIEFF